jgi:putative inorganic carbon (hco3(-)) transporter
MISTPLRERLLSSFSLENSTDAAFIQDSNSVRIYVWQVTLKMIRDYPVLGVGSGVYPGIYDKYTKLETREDFRHKAFAHNIFLQVAAEFGIPGLTIFCLMLSILFYISFSLARTKNPIYQGMFASLVGLMIHQQVDIPIWGVGIGGAFWMLAGLSIGLYQYEWSAGRLKTKNA